MQAGGERRITIPADKAYGKKAMPGEHGFVCKRADTNCFPQIYLPIAHWFLMSSVSRSSRTRLAGVRGQE